MKHLLFLIVFIYTLPATLSAQSPEFKVTSFTHEANSMLARLNHNVRLDDNDEACALILVRTAETGLGFTANTVKVGDSDWKNGEYWLYVSQNTRSIKVFKQGIETLEYTLEIIPKSRETYLLKLQVIRPELKIAILPVTIITTPENANLSIDGKSISHQSQTVELAVGEHNLVIEMSGYKKLEKTIEVNRNNTYFNFSLNEISNVGLMIDSKPQEAEVFLDGIFLGKTPFSAFYPPGNYKLKLTKRGYLDIDNTTLIVKSPETRKTYVLEDNSGIISINTSKSAKVTINNIEYKDPQNIKLLPQLLRINVSMPKAESIEKQIVLNQNDNLNLDLFPIIKTSSLQVAVTPFDAKIEITGDAGEYYTATGMKIFDKIPIGTYTIKVSAPNHTTKEEIVLLKTDDSIEKSIKLIKNVEEIEDIEDKADDKTISYNTNESSSKLENICNCLVGEYSFENKQAKINKNRALVSFSNGYNVSKKEFFDTYMKNNPDNAYNQETLREYLNLFIIFKMKIFDAVELDMANDPAFVTELNGYCLKIHEKTDEYSEFSNELLNEAYQRLKKDIRASHILIVVDENASPKDTLVAYHKILKIRNEVIAGKEFASAAVEYSEDPSAKDTEAIANKQKFKKGNKGDLGYFTVFNMVYPFENAAYSTGLNSISPIVRTKYGYHILKVTDIKNAMGSAKVAHIFVSLLHGTSIEDSLRRVEKINNIYAKIEEGMSFNDAVKEYSEDKGSVKNNGELSEFTCNRVVHEFIEVVGNLEVGEISAPFKTNYGFHIIKLISINRPGTYEEEETKLKERLAKDSRSYYNLWLLDINTKNCQTTIKQIEQSNPQFLDLLSEYYDGILLFNLTDKMVWTKAVSDTVAQYRLYNSQKENYQNKSFKDARGIVTADLQTKLENEWMSKLRTKYQPKINYSILESIK